MVHAKAAVSMHALLQRINRKLAKTEEALKAARGHRMQRELGDYYVVNLHMNVITQKHVDPLTLATELGLVAGWERVITDAEKELGHGSTCL